MNRERFPVNGMNAAIQKNAHWKFHQCKSVIFF